MYITYFFLFSFSHFLHRKEKTLQMCNVNVFFFLQPQLFFLILFTLGCLFSCYQCWKSGSALHKHFKVYKRSQCCQCFHVITVCCLGDNGRMTYRTTANAVRVEFSVGLTSGRTLHTPLTLTGKVIYITVRYWEDY